VTEFIRRCGVSWQDRLFSEEVFFICLIGQNRHIKNSHAEICLKFASVCVSNMIMRPLALTDNNLHN